MSKVSVTWFGFGEASSHGGPRNELGGEGVRGDVGRSGGRGGGFVWSDPRAGLPVLQVTQQCVQEKLQSHAGHRWSFLLLHALYAGERSEVIDTTRLKGAHMTPPVLLREQHTHKWVRVRVSSVCISVSTLTCKRL